MLFSSLEFIFAFLPLVMLVGFALRRFASASVLLGAILCANLFFYGWFRLDYLPLLIGSIVVNYVLGKWLMSEPRRAVLIAGVAANLALLGFFKYAGFFSASVGLDIPRLQAIVLPLAISFYTFQQISFLVDCHRRRVLKARFLDYAVYVSFFPQLIAGPIVRFSELYSQLAPRLFRPQRGMVAAGISLFIFGLAKKVVIADTLSAPVDATWVALVSTAGISQIDAWTAVFAYSFQIYFDFSAYSDMAIGLGLIMGVTLPVNFLSPYKAVSIRDFWRRWHITLSRWLRDYLYIPLGGSRFGFHRQLAAVLVTMGLGGLWHGAGWNFVLWGLLHGLWIALSHLTRRDAASDNEQSRGRRIVSTALTFLGITALWIFFRGENGDWFAMFVALFSSTSTASGLFENHHLLIMAVAALITFAGPANAHVFNVIREGSWLRFEPRVTFAVASSVMFLLAVTLMIEGKPNAFIYFQF